MTAYIADGERPIMVISYDKKPGRALRKAGKIIDGLCKMDNYAHLSSINVFLDDDENYNVTAIVSTPRL